MTSANVDTTEGIALSLTDFNRVRALIHREAGISLMDSKRMMVQSRLNRRLVALGCTSFSGYLDRVERERGELQEFINALTTNLTSFYREQYHFPILAQHLQSSVGTHDISMWCGAASTGEEPYSIAMTAARTLGSRRRWKLLATDIDTRVLDTARRGVYGVESIANVPETDRRTFMMRGSGANEGMIRMRQDLVRQVRFDQFNLIAPQWQVDGQPFDLVFLRNVLIYFDGPTKLQILQKMHQVIRPGGLLFIGHSESFNDTGGLFRLEGRTVYRRLDLPGRAG